MKIVIIIPTYNERENIRMLLEALNREAGAIAHEMHVLVVDDESPDGTAEVVRDYIKNCPNVHLITGKKKGLGNAYIRGMRHAIDVLGADAVFEMDADFSHKPEDVRRMTACLDEGYDFVIGSRYIKGGTIPKNWGIHRRLNSLFGNLVTRYIAGIYSVRDCTAGFRAIRADLLRKVDLSSISVQGYTFQVALLNRAVINGARIKEIPVEFVDRTRGVSKLGLADISEFLINVGWIRFQKSKTFIKFAIVGASGVIVNLAVFGLLSGLGTNKFLASPIATEISILWNFVLNNRWTFRWRVMKQGVHIRGLRFNVVSFLSLAISYLVFVILSLKYPAGAPAIHQITAIIPATAVNYFLNSYWTFEEAKIGRAQSDDSVGVFRSWFRSLAAVKSSKG
jgi:dolichol-phosphate mannosyltransferase